jgi:eukaryotic-like serine/threonine-protein kinase
MIGERVGNYVVTAQLGEGGMGVVYLAEHPQIGKKVALKLLHAGLASNQDIVTRFFNEAKAVNAIGHPNIVDILDFGSLSSPHGTLS